MADENAAYQRLIDDNRKTIKDIARQIRENPVTAEVEGGAINATALANGQITGVYISARAQRGFDNQTLSELVTSAIQQAMDEAAKVELDGLRASTQGRASSLNDIFGAGLADIRAEIEEEDRREQAEANRWSFRYQGRPAPPTSRR